MINIVRRFASFAFTRMAEALASNFGPSVQRNLIPVPVPARVPSQKARNLPRNLRQR